MAKFYGAVGYAITEETKPGVWEETITERMYFGDLIQTRRRFESSGNLNDDLSISNEISILADPFANEHFSSMRYIEFMGAKWKISDVEIKYPRLILTIGGVYNSDGSDEDTDA